MIRPVVPSIGYCFRISWTQQLWKSDGNLSEQIVELNSLIRRSLKFRIIFFYFFKFVRDERFVLILINLCGI